MFLKQNVRSLRRRHNAICFGCFVLCCGMMRFERKVWRYQRGNQKPINQRQTDNTTTIRNWNKRQAN